MISTGDWVDGSPSLFKIVFLERKKEKKEKKKNKKRHDERKVDKRVDKKIPDR